MAKLDDYFKQKTKNISFIESKPGTYIDVNGYKVSYEVPLPIVLDDLLDEVKTSEDGEEIKFISFINGIIYTIGVDPKFKYREDYSNILYSYDEKIEDYILYRGLKNINDGDLELGVVWLRALAFLNKENLFGRYNYALAVGEKAKQALELKDKNLSKKFLEASTEMLEEIIDDDPNFSLALYKLGYHYKSKNEFRKSQITWEKFLRLGKEQELIDEIREELELIKDDVIYEEGYNLILEGYSVEGLEKLLPMTDKYDKWWNLFFMIGLAYRQIGEFEKAKIYFEKVLEIEENQVDALNELGLCLVYLGEGDLAIDKFTKAIEKRPRDYEIMCNRGMTYLQKHDIEKARVDIMKAYELNPNDEITIACRGELESYLS